MKKILTIAAREYRAMVGTKAFLVSIFMMPILMLGGLIAVPALQNVGKIKERKIVVFEGGNNVFDDLQKAAEQHNALIQSSDAQNSDSEKPGMPTTSGGELFILERADSNTATDEELVRLSNEIRESQLYGFLEIPENLLEPTGGETKARFYSQDSSIADARGWLAAELNRIVRKQRLEQFLSGEQIVQVDAASMPIPVSGMGLVEQDSNGDIIEAEEKNQIADIFLPMGIMMLMFMVIFMAAQPMLESVLEEKSQRIAEVLLGSVSSFQLMVGKLLGTVSGSLTIFAIYFVGAYFVANDRGWLDNLPWEILPWFILFQVLAVLFYASIFMAVGASVSQLKEAQSMLLPVWMLMMIPMFVWILIIRDPQGELAKWISLFPPSASTTMVLRMATGQPIPMWQVFLSLTLLILATLVIITIAGRIFRVGILWQGKVPKLNELIRWGLKG
ncbi:MAG: ABC transporter permease [Pirellulaceae bacterium]